MSVERDQEGNIFCVRERFGYYKSVSLKKWNNFINLFINDNVKCFETGTFDITKSKSVCLKWKEALQLRDVINELEQYGSEMQHSCEIADNQFAESQPPQKRQKVEAKTPETRKQGQTVKRQSTPAHKSTPIQSRVTERQVNVFRGNVKRPVETPASIDEMMLEEY